MLLVLLMAFISKQTIIDFFSSLPSRKKRGPIHFSLTHCNFLSGVNGKIMPESRVWSVQSLSFHNMGQTESLFQCSKRGRVRAVAHDEYWNSCIHSVIVSQSFVPCRHYLNPLKCEKNCSLAKEWAVQPQTNLPFLPANNAIIRQAMVCGRGRPLNHRLSQSTTNSAAVKKPFSRSDSEGLE